MQLRLLESRVSETDPSTMAEVTSIRETLKSLAGRTDSLRGYL